MLELIELIVPVISLMVVLVSKISNSFLFMPVGRKYSSRFKEYRFVRFVNTILKIFTVTAFFVFSMLFKSEIYDVCVKSLGFVSYPWKSVVFYLLVIAPLICIRMLVVYKLKTEMLKRFAYFAMDTLILILMVSVFYAPLEMNGLESWSSQQGIEIMSRTAIVVMILLLSYINYSYSLDFLEAYSFISIRFANGSFENYSDFLFTKSTYLFSPTDRINFSLMDIPSFNESRYTEISKDQILSIDIATYWAVAYSSSYHVTKSNRMSNFFSAI